MSTNTPALPLAEPASECAQGGAWFPPMRMIADRHYMWASFFLPSVPVWDQEEPAGPDDVATGQTTLSQIAGREKVTCCRLVGLPHC